MKYLKVKNWKEYQHYKDRNPPWIKLHRKILNDRNFMQLPTASRGLLLCLWVLAAEEDGYILYDEEELRFRLRLPELQLSDLDFLVECGFLKQATEKEGFKSPWASRYIKPEDKQKTMERCENKCVFCGSKKNLEYDHIVPISQGGNSNVENIQILCRSCNRKKRAYVAGATQEKDSVAAATHFAPETETETETKAETKKKPPLALPDWLDKQTWVEFKKHRQKMNKGGMTPHAESLMIGKLSKFREQGHDPNEMLERSILNGWKGVFPGKGKDDEPTHPSHRILTRSDDA